MHDRAVVVTPHQVEKAIEAVYNDTASVVGRTLRNSGLNARMLQHAVSSQITKTREEAAAQMRSKATDFVERS